MKPFRPSRVVVAVAVALVTAACSDDGSSTTTAPTGGEGSGQDLEFSVASVGGTEVEVTVTNTSESELAVVRPFVTPHFVVFRLTGPGGDEIPFDGPYPRLEPLVDTDIARLAPGESASSRFDLADHFDVPAGTVTLEAAYRAREVHHGGLGLTVDPEDPVTATPIEIEVTG